MYALHQMQCQMFAYQEFFIAVLSWLNYVLTNGTI